MNTVRPYNRAITGASYNVSGKIVDDANGSPVYGATINIINKSTGNPTGEQYKPDTNLFSITINNPGSVLIEVTKEGFFPTIGEPADMQGEVSLISENQNKSFLPIAVGAALLLLMAKKKNKKVGFTTTDVMPWLLISGALIVFNKGNQLLQWLGLSPSPATINLDNATSDPNSFWNPNFWTTAPNHQYSYAITEQQARDIIAKLKDAMSWWNDDEAAAVSALKQLKTQANLSFVAWEFAKTDNQDLLTWLRGNSYPNDRLSDSEVYSIHNYFANLPKY